MKLSVFLLCKDANTVPCGKHKSHKVYFTNREMFALSNTRSPSSCYYAQRAAETKFYQYLSKSAPSLPEKKMGGRALSDLWDAVTFEKITQCSNAWCFMATDQCESVHHSSVGPLLKGRTHIGSPLHKMSPIRQCAMSFQILLLSNPSREKKYIHSKGPFTTVMITSSHLPYKNVLRHYHRDLTWKNS